MKIFFKAGNSANVGLLLIRLSLGTLFLFAGAKKVINLQDFISSVQEMGKMSDNAAFILAFVLPFMEMLFGALYIIGLFTPITSFAIAVMCISFLLVQGPWHYEMPFSHNFVFLSCALATMISGAGKISFDAFIDREKSVKDKGSSETIQRPVVLPVPEEKIAEQIELKEEEKKSE